MSASASLMSSLRSSFSSHGMVNLDQPIGMTVTPSPTEPLTSKVNATAEKLDILENILNEVMAQKTVPIPDPVSVSDSSALASAVPMAVDQTIQATNQAWSSTPAKESRVATVVNEQVSPVATSETPILPETPLVPETPAVQETANAQPMEAGLSHGMQEVEPPAPEISEEVAEYLQEVKEHQEQLPHEIVMANNDIQIIPQAQPLRPVVVLPITPELEKEGAKKNPKWSVRWLVEWSRRLMKVFAGKIVYSET